MKEESEVERKINKAIIDKDVCNSNGGSGPHIYPAVRRKSELCFENGESCGSEEAVCWRKMFVGLLAPGGTWIDPSKWLDYE